MARQAEPRQNAVVLGWLVALFAGTSILLSTASSWVAAVSVPSYAGFSLSLLAFARCKGREYGYFARRREADLRDAAAPPQVFLEQHDQIRRVLPDGTVQPEAFSVPRSTERSPGKALTRKGFKTRRNRAKPRRDPYVPRRAAVTDVAFSELVNRLERR